MSRVETLRPLGRRALPLEAVDEIDESRILHPDFRAPADLDAVLQKLEFTDEERTWLQAHKLDGVSRTAAPAALGWTPTEVERVRKSAARRLKRTKVVSCDFEPYFGEPGRAYVEKLDSGRRVWALTRYNSQAESIIQTEREQLFTKKVRPTCPQEPILMPLGRGPLMAETKKFSLTLKSLSETGQFEGLASVYGNVDLGGDIVEAGAFTKTLKERGSEVPILWQHEPGSSVGLGRLEDTSKGLVIRGQLEMDLPEAKSAYIRLKKGLVRGLSIGFKAVKDHIENGIRHITEAKLYEVSLVTFPMNEMAQVTTVKAASQLTFEQKKLFLKQLARAVELDLFATQLEWRFSRVLDDLQEHLLYQLRSL